MTQNPPQMTTDAIPEEESPSEKDGSPDQKMMRYREPHRPQLKFSPKENWMNDPNGMVLIDDTFHLFYQYYPHDTVWGPMHWGHATSTDLLHWQEEDIALFPDDKGWIFSGCAIVDEDNLSGLATGNGPVILAYFTYHSEPDVQMGFSDYQTQALAYSNDQGKTWRKYHNNPILQGDGETDFRDPKVVWHQDSNQWLMLVAAGKCIKVYNSANLIDWQFLSAFGNTAQTITPKGSHDGVWECPDLITLTSQDGTQLDCLIVSVGDGAPHGGSGTQYFLGQFNGTEFIENHQETLWLDQGPDNYAGVTWHIPKHSIEDRALFIGWMNNQAYASKLPTSCWRGNMTSVRELKLVVCGDQYRVSSGPCEELNYLVSDVSAENEFTFQGYKTFLPPGNLTSPFMFDLEVDDGLHNKLDICISNEREEFLTVCFLPEQQRLVVERDQAGNVDFHPQFKTRISSDFIQDLHHFSVKLVIDHGGIEVFVNDGAHCLTVLSFPSTPWNKVSIATDEKLHVTSCQVSKLTSVYDQT